MNETDHAQEIEDIYRQLEKGLGHELVNDDNVHALIRRAEQDGHEDDGDDHRQRELATATTP